MDSSIFLLPLGNCWVLSDNDRSFDFASFGSNCLSFSWAVGKKRNEFVLEK